MHKLTALAVKNARPGRHGDGGGLWLQVGPTGTKAWLFRYMIDGRARAMGLGAADTFSLKEARERARSARQLLADGKDPLEVKHGERGVRRLAAAKNVTFKACAEEFLAVSPAAKKWTNAEHRRQWEKTLADYVYPALGDLPFADVDVALVQKTLLPIWQRVPETASRVRGRIERVLAYATASGLRSGDNPAAWRNLKDVFGTVERRSHHEALPYNDVPTFVAELRDRDGMAARALEFLILTAGRTNEVLGAKWEEINVDLWTVPAERMKKRREHVVPLSDDAASLIRSLPRISDFIFDGIGDQSMMDLLRNMRFAATVHGFRSSFRDWAGDRTAFSHEVIEFALAHGIPDQSKAAYRRYRVLEKRRKLMEAWAQYCSAPMSGKVVVLHGGRS
jgi:integrase